MKHPESPTTLTLLAIARISRRHEVTKLPSLDETFTEVLRIYSEDGRSVPPKTYGAVSSALSELRSLTGAELHERVQDEVTKLRSWTKLAKCALRPLEEEPLTKAKRSK